MPSLDRRRPRARAVALVLALGALAIGAAGCGAIATTPPAPTPADFPGIGSELVRRGIGIEHITSGDAGCGDVELARTAIAVDAQGLDQLEPTRVYFYIFRNRDAFERLRQTVDACAAAYVTDPAAFEAVEASPYVIAGPGPWAPDFRTALREAILEAAGTGN